MDILVFNRWRRATWWKAPLWGSLVASVVDTGVFFFLAFAGSEMNWLQLTGGDLAVKAAHGRAAAGTLPRVAAAPGAAGPRRGPPLPEPAAGLYRCRPPPSDLPFVI